MKIKLLASILALASGAAQSGGLLFDVVSENKGLNLPITLCLSGVAQMSCQNYTATGLDLYIKTRTTNTTNFPNAGIRLNTTGYKLSNCVPHQNGYCIFAANSFNPVLIQLK